MIKILALGMAVMCFVVGACSAALLVYLLVATVISKGYYLLFTGPGMLFSGVTAALFFIAGNACLATARIDKNQNADVG